MAENGSHNGMEGFFLPGVCPSACAQVAAEPTAVVGSGADADDPWGC